MAPAGGGVAARRSSAHKKAARVLPDPVGATTRACSPRLTASQAPTWAGVGAANAWVNQARVAGEKRSSTAPGRGPGAEGVRSGAMLEVSLPAPTHALSGRRRLCEGAD